MLPRLTILFILPYWTGANNAMHISSAMVYLYEDGPYCAEAYPHLFGRYFNFNITEINVLRGGEPPPAIREIKFV